MAFRVYVAAAFDRAVFVRQDVHERLRSLGIEPTSRWADEAAGPEQLDGRPLTVVRGFAVQNDRDLRGSDAVLMLADGNRGGERFCEARVALEWGKPVVWVGTRILSAFRPGVLLAEDLDDGLRILVGMRVRHALGYRGDMLTIDIDSISNVG